MGRRAKEGERMIAPFGKRRERLLQLRELRCAGEGPASLSRQTCPACEHELVQDELVHNLHVCPHCGHHLRIGAHDRLASVLDAGSFREFEAKMASSDPLGFPDYAEKVRTLRKNTGLSDALVCGWGSIDGIRVAVAVLDTSFLMGSMGAVVGEKLTRLIERAGKKKCPLIVFSASGGARMQEGIISLMQMAKTSAAIERFSGAGGLFISVMTNPTMGGVTASFASLGDIMLAEPGALIGFAGPRVIEQTIGESLPKGFQRAEFQLSHGFIDAVVPRGRMRAQLSRLLMLHGFGGVARGSQK